MTRMRPSRIAGVLRIAGFMVTAALAQAANYTSVEATAGMPMQLTLPRFGKQEVHGGAGANHSRLTPDLTMLATRRRIPKAMRATT